VLYRLSYLAKAGQSSPVDPSLRTIAGGRLRRPGGEAGQGVAYCCERCPKDQSLFPTKFSGVTRMIAIACASTFPSPSRTSR